MDEQDVLATRFEAERPHLRAVAFRMLGSLAEADDAVQECWLRLSRTDSSPIENLGGWLTTAVARICLDHLRTRASQHADSLEDHIADPIASREDGIDPEQEALLAESVGLALLVVLDRLAPAERIAFVLHDLFDVPFEQIAPIVGRSSTAARQLASRARRRVRGTATDADADLMQNRSVVDAFLAASRVGDFEALLTLLDPNVVFHTRTQTTPSGKPIEFRGASKVARQISFGSHRGAGQPQETLPVLVEGSPGIAVIRPKGLFLVLKLTIIDEKITEIEAVTDPTRLNQLELTLFDD